MKYGFCKEFSTPMKTEIDYELIKMIKEAGFDFVEMRAMLVESVSDEEFLKLKTDEPKLFYIWGHAYEFDIHNDWKRFEEFLEMISGRDDIFYGTNSECLL